MACALVALVCAGYLALAWHGFELVDEGYFLAHARRVQLGSLPYRDFSTPYTPGVFYLYAWLMDWLGPAVVVLRALQVVARGVTCLALYAAGRRVMPPFFAALPPALMLAVDPAPPIWDIHPGWYATAAAALMVLAVAAYVRDGRARWLLAAGAAAGAGFAFKQNQALFGLMAALWLLAVTERHLPRVGAPHRFGRRPAGPASPTEAARRVAPAPAVRAGVQVAALALLPLAAAVLVWPYRSPLLAAVFVLPLAALSVTAATRLTWRGPVRAAVPAGAGATLGREGSFHARLLLVLAGFGAVTLPWLVPLIRALDGRFELLRSYLGQIDPSGYYYGLTPPDFELARRLGVLLLLPVVVGGVAGRRRAVFGCSVAACLAAAGMAAAGGFPGQQGCPGCPGGAPWHGSGVAGWAMDTAASAWRTYRWEFGRPRDDLLLYLPALAFWPALAVLVIARNGGQPAAEPGSGAAPPGRPDLLRLWYLVAGAALLLTQYPRMDHAHMIWAGGLLFLVGADLLHRWYAAALERMPGLRRSRPGRLAFQLSLALLPAMAALPYFLVRVEHAYHAFYTSLRPPLPWALGFLDEQVTADGRLEPLHLLGSGHRVWARADFVRPTQAVVDFLQAHTAPGEPIFAYPVIPGIYFLADRPNATRFNHLFPGMASPADLQEMVRQLEQVRYVVWDDANAPSWVNPGDNAPVMEYLRGHFREAAVIGPYAVLARDGSGPPRPKAQG